jgi:thymidine kinase
MQPHLTPHDIGWIEVITGCMFSGKTEELIRRIRRTQYAHLPVVVFKPAIDLRYSDDSVGSHTGTTMRSFQITHSREIPGLVGDAMVVGIDEAQFLDDGLIDVCNALADSGKRVIVAGLDLDYLGKPFGPMAHMMAVAEYVQKTLALCVLCGNPADRSQRIIRGDTQVLVGETEAYEARCRKHWDPTEERASQQRLPFGINLAEEAASTTG